MNSKAGTALDPDSDHYASYLYESGKGRLQEITSAGGHEFNYSYASSSNRVSQLSSALGSAVFNQYRVYDGTRGVLNYHENKIGSATIAKYDYAYETNAPRITSIAKTGEIFEAYGPLARIDTTFTYDSRGRLTKAEPKQHNGSAWVLLDSRTEEWAYDYAGNRIEHQPNKNAGMLGDSANSLNQINWHAYSGKSYLTGVAPEGSSFSVMPANLVLGAVTQRAGAEFFEAPVKVSDNWIMETRETYTITTDEVIDQEAQQSIDYGPDSHLIHYDEDGNIKAELTHASRDYQDRLANPENRIPEIEYKFDAENRLVEIKKVSNPAGSGKPLPTIISAGAWARNTTTGTASTRSATSGATSTTACR